MLNLHGNMLITNVPAGDLNINHVPGLISNSHFGYFLVFSSYIFLLKACQL